MKKTHLAGKHKKHSYIGVIGNKVVLWYPGIYTAIGTDDKVSVVDLNNGYRLIFINTTIFKMAVLIDKIGCGSIPCYIVGSSRAYEIETTSRIFKEEVVLHARKASIDEWELAVELVEEAAEKGGYNPHIGDIKKALKGLAKELENEISMFID